MLKLEEIKVVGIPFINSDWKMETTCPACREIIKFCGRVDKQTKRMITDTKFCKFCGQEIDWDVKHLL
jgi:transcription elongation factor Elf1